MNDRERLHREDPIRTDPIREWAKLWRRPDSWGIRGPTAKPQAGEGPSPADSWSDVVAGAVDLGYRVVDEQIRQGQRVAQQINNQSYGPGTMGTDAQEIGERLVRYSADAWALWMDFLNALLGNSDLIRNAPRPFQPTAAPSARSTAEKPATVSVEIASSRPARVTIELQPKSEGRPLATFELRALDASKPPLTDIAFERDPSNEIVSVRIRVPDGQPSGVYTGVVVDRETGQARGTLSVRVTE